MSNLKDLYQERDTFLKYGSEVPLPLISKIAAAEKKERLNELLPIIEDAALKSLPRTDIDGKLIVAMEYDDGELSRVAVSQQAELFEKFDVVKSVMNVVKVLDENTLSKMPRSKSINFSVTFPDGKVFNYKKAQWTLIDSLNYMGLERVSHFTGEKFKGFPLVGKEQRITPDGQKWQKLVDGWWIYINMSNERKVRCLNGVASMLNIPIVIRWQESSTDDPDYTPESPDVTSKVKGKRAMFSLNGEPPSYKNRAVLNTVQHFIMQMSNATYKDVCDFFPKSLQGSYGVVMTLNEIHRRMMLNKTEERCWFLDKNEILTSSDGVKFAVCTQWGDNFASFQKHVADQLGWSLEEVE